MPEAKLSMKLANPPVKSSKINSRYAAHGSRSKGFGFPFWFSMHRAFTRRVCGWPCALVTLLDRKDRGT
jgi:hypothetical protein